MQRNFTMRRTVILSGLGLLLAADIALAAYNWRSGAGVRTPQQMLAVESQQLKLLKADVERARGIRKQMPAIQQDCERFEKSLPPASSGYSSLVSQLGGVAKSAGVKVTSLTFKTTEVAKKPFLQVTMEATIEGDYTSVVRFLNGLQKSDGLFIVNDLSLASSPQIAGGALRVNLHLQTYFRKTV